MSNKDSTFAGICFDITYELMVYIVYYMIADRPLMLISKMIDWEEKKNLLAMTNHDKMAVGSRAQVYKGLAKKTSGGLTKKDILAKKDKSGGDDAVRYAGHGKLIAVQR